MLRILLVEDDVLNQRMLTLRLTKMGYDVVTANNGKEAIENASVNQPDLILMDMDLPEVSGWDATSFLKKNQNTRHIPIIAVTANAMKGDREKTLSVGCDEYEPKPIDYDSLKEKITKLVKK